VNTLMKPSERTRGIASSIHGERKCTVTNTDRNAMYYVVVFKISRSLCTFASSGRTRPALL